MTAFTSLVIFFSLIIWFAFLKCRISFDTGKEVIDAVRKDGLFTERQYQKLSAKIEEGRIIGDMYLIGEYLSEKIKPSTSISTERENNHVI